MTIENRVEPRMNWIALHRSALWRGLWESPDMQKMLTTLRNQIINGNFEPEQRGRLVGRLQILEEMPRWVERQAVRQESETPLTPGDREAKAADDRFLAILPRI